MTSVLFVVSAADTWTLKDGSKHPTGYWGEEVAAPHQIFTDAGWDITIATPGGVPPTLDKLSVALISSLPTTRRRTINYLKQIQPELDHPVSLDSVDEADFDLVFYPGGHGPMEDLSSDPVSGALLVRRLAAGKPLALLCHGPAAAVAATKDDGTNAFAGYRMTALANLEERVNPFAHKAKWLLQDKLTELGVDYAKGLLPFRPYVVVDRNVYTGENPQSARALAKRLVAELGEPAASAG